MTRRRVTPREEDPGQHAIDYIEAYLTHTKGQWAGEPFILEDWQREDVIRPLFGELNEHGLRRYRTAYIEIPRKNGKSEMAAAVALKLLTADGEMGAEVYGAASDRDQASIVFNVAKVMVANDPALSERCKVYRTKVIEVPKTGSVYRVLSADAYTKHGLNAHGVVFDEVHAQPNRELWDVLTTSTGARRQPLIFAITTAGYNRNSVCYELHDYGLKVLSGVVHDPTFFAYIRSLAEGEDWRDEANWFLANPALGVFRSLDEMRDMARRAAETPALENTFRRLYLNQWTSQDVRWMPMDKWDLCDGEVTPEAVKGMPCYAGLDLASTTDIAALVLVFAADDGTFYVKPHFWIPEEAIELRTKRDRVPYAAWVQQGYIEATPGNVIDYKSIRARLGEYNDQCWIKELAFDRWGATQLIQDLQEDGLTVVPFGQGFASMSPPTKELLNKVLKREVAHGGNPVLRWMADNVTVRQDPAGNLKPDKSKSTEKIDGIVAFIMALDRAVRGAVQGYSESKGLLILGGDDKGEAQ